LYIISFVFFQIIQSSNLLFIVGSFVRALAKNGSFGFLSVSSCVGKNQMCHLWVGCLFTLTHNVLALGAVADFGAQNCQYTTKVDAR